MVRCDWSSDVCSSDLNLEGVGTSDKWTISKNKEYWDQKDVSMDKINFQVVKEINTGINLYKIGRASCRERV